MKLLYISLLFIISCKPGHKEIDKNGFPEAAVKVDINQLETTFPRGGRIWALDWSPNGTHIAIGNRSGLVRIYNAENQKLEKILTGFEKTINGVHWSPDGKKIAASGNDPRIIIWDLENGSRIIITGHSRQVRSVQWSPEGTYLASTSHDGTIRIWNEEGEYIKKFEGANFGCVGIDWYDEDKIVASCWDNTIRTYSLSRKDSLIIENGNHRAKAVLGIDWHPSGNVLASGDYGNAGDTAHVIKLWSDKGDLIKSMDDHTMEIRDLSWSPNGEILATGGETVRLWDKNGDPLRIFESNNSPVWSLDWDPKGKKIASGHNDGKVRIWNIEGEEIAGINGHSTEITSMSYSNDSLRLALGYADGLLRLFDLENLTSITYKGHVRGITSIAWSHSQEFLAVSSNDMTGTIWEVKGIELTNPVKLIGYKESMLTIEWNEDDTKLATGSYDSSISVWNTKGEAISSIATDLQRINKINWVNGTPEGSYIDNDDEYYAPSLPITIARKKMYLLALNENRFALIDEFGNLVKGDPNDFVIISDEQNGISEIIPLSQK